MNPPVSIEFNYLNSTCVYSLPKRGDVFIFSLIIFTGDNLFKNPF